VGIRATLIKTIQRAEVCGFRDSRAGEHRTNKLLPSIRSQQFRLDPFKAELSTEYANNLLHLEFRGAAANVHTFPQDQMES
jgi:hypothetical protein